MKLRLGVIWLKWLVSITIVTSSEGFASVKLRQTTLSLKSKTNDNDNEIKSVYGAKTISSFDKYKKIHAESIKDPAKYWVSLMVGW